MLNSLSIATLFYAVNRMVYNYNGVAGALSAASTMKEFESVSALTFKEKDPTEFG